MPSGITVMTMLITSYALASISASATPSETQEILMKISDGRASPQRIFFLFLQ